MGIILQKEIHHKGTSQFHALVVEALISNEIVLILDNMMELDTTILLLLQVNRRIRE
ncbi:hypothetical protein Mapa_003057 [Marchantia paleacea]|nr:hypothetical protein Mapa_017291 [Marchantia paleacea]KAG6555025.1 hypothetical protein Mapa_003057 [Marchantia paleacea]